MTRTRFRGSDPTPSTEGEQPTEQTEPTRPTPSTDPEQHRRAAAAATIAAQPIAQAPVTGRQGARFRGIGEFMHAVACGRIDSTERERYFRALTVATTADDALIARDQWVTEIVDFIGSAQPFVSAFSSLPLPESGMTVAFPRVTTRPATAKQAAQLDEVATGKLVIARDSAGVETYAGGTRVSLQEVQRSDPSYLTMLFELHGEEMAKDMDTGAIAAVAADVPSGNKLDITTGEWTSLNGRLVTGVKKILASRAPFDPVFVIGLDLWEEFASAVDADGRPLFPHVNGFNPVGQVTLTDPTNGSARSLPYVVDPNMTATKGYLGWRRAYTSMMGSLQTLSADAVANLGRDEVVFQYCAHLVRRPDAIVEYTLIPA